MEYGHGFRDMVNGPMCSNSNVCLRRKIKGELGKKDKKRMRYDTWRTANKLRNRENEPFYNKFPNGKYKYLTKRESTSLKMTLFVNQHC